MKKSIVSVTLMALAVASVMSVMMTTARADTKIFNAVLLAANEPSGVAPTEANANGNVTVTLDTVANTAAFTWTVSGFPAGDLLILSHVHQGPAGVNGPVRIDSQLSPATAIPVVNGAASFSRGNLTASATVIQQIIADPSQFYFNVHSILTPGGAVRGQLVAQQAPIPPGAATNAPTLSEWGAILMTLLIVAVGVFFVANRSSATAYGAGGGAGMTSGISRPINWKLLSKVTIYVEAAIALGLIALHSVIAAPDVVGSLASGLIVAFIIHLFVGGSRR